MTPPAAAPATQPVLVSGRDGPGAVMPRVICLEGPSAVGKTRLAEALERECGAAVVPELDARDAPPIGRSAAWFAERSAERWQLAVARAAAAPFVVLDGDPFKALWFNWIYAADGWEALDIVEPLYRSHLERGALAFPDLYVVLQASADELRARRASDPTRRRRNFETHLRMVRPQRRYFEALRAADPPRVAIVESSRRPELVGRVTDALRSLPARPPDSRRLLEYAIGWVRGHSPLAEGIGRERGGSAS